jgi:MFS family permease
MIMGITRKQFLLITAVALGTLLNPLNTTMIAVAFSRLQEDFQVTYQGISWLIASFYVTSAIAQPIFGRLSDQYGPKKIFMIGLALVTVASILAPLSPGFGWLIAFRVVQSAGSAALFPSGMSMIRSTVTGNQARVLGIMSIFSSTSAGLGPSLGGILIHYGDWPILFLINFPFLIVSFILAVMIMPKDQARSNSAQGEMDYAGMAFFAGFIMVLLIFLLTLQDGFNFLFFGLSVALGIGFYQYQARKSQPFINVHFLKKNKDVSLIYLQFILVNAIFYSVMFGIPSYLQQVRHFDSKTVGLVMLSVAGLGVFIAPLAGRWIDRVGSRIPLIVGTVSLLAGTTLMITLGNGASALWIFAILSLIGFSNGIQNIGLQTALYSFVSKKETGLASGLFMTSRFVGTMFSSSILAAMFGKEITTGRLHLMAITCAVISLCLLVMSVRMSRAAGIREVEN